jgi:methyl-accepting chemotaxis protein
MEYSIQLIVAIACWVIAIMFAVQVVVWFLLYRIAKAAMDKVNEVQASFEPRVEQVMRTVGELQTTVKDVSQTVTTVSTEVLAVSSAVTTSAERISVIATESAEQLRTTIVATSADIKELVTSTSTEVKDLVTTTSTDVRAIMSTSRNATQGAVDRIDLMVERTARRVEETGAFVQSQVLDPVREVSAIVVGIKVALETLIGYPERRQIDQAYSEEELFI